MLIQAFAVLLAASTAKAGAVDRERRATLITAPSALQPRACRGYRLSCSPGARLRFNKGQADFTAMHCADGRGRHTNPTINLSRCLGNTGGRLVGGHDFHKTCRDFVVTGSVLHANCDDGSGFEKWPATFFDLGKSYFRTAW
ncbi:hypothetical protein PCL_09127 [Purpureocillium lilacinum]|uniref:Cyanovirin-N domain-containing protein n=1 Tax=Purpureocillium lilacinum TaxID=33203 RepID=A0A2U3EH70_PURLI|nr:hypothetical protein PCL_09127 [Purpureocillium lilacinum]